MFSASADLYDLIYAQFKDYPSEATVLASLIRREHPTARTVLDVACGTGEHARLLADVHGFHVDALDLDPGFVRIAAKKIPNGRVYEQDMAAFAIDRRYDVILSLFSSIGYARDLNGLRHTLARFHAHLAPEGLVIVEPWFEPGALTPGKTMINTAESPGVSIARVSHVSVEDRISTIRFEYLIGTSRGIQHTIEEHELGLFTTAEILDAFRSVGLEAKHDPVGLDGRGLFLARPVLD